MNAINLTLYVPGLFGVDNRAGFELPGSGELPALEQLLSKADHSVAEARTLSQGIVSLFASGSTATTLLPTLAGIACQGAGLISQSAVVCADPVYLRADQDRLILFEASILDLSADEAQGLVVEINNACADNAWRLECADSTHWFLHTDAQPDMVTHEPATVAGRNIERWLPSGPDGGIWRRYLNEVQMVLHTSNINAQRESSGRLPVSSLWFWGTDTLSGNADRCWTSVAANNLLARGLAVEAKAALVHTPADLNAWLDQVRDDGDHLVILDSSYHTAINGDVDAWRQGLLDLETLWFAPVAKALHDGVLASCTIDAGDYGRFHLSRRALGRWWRRRRALSWHQSATSLKNP